MTSARRRRLIQTWQQSWLFISLAGGPLGTTLIRARLKTFTRTSPSSRWPASVHSMTPSEANSSSSSCIRSQVDGCATMGAWTSSYRTTSSIFQSNRVLPGESNCKLHDPRIRHGARDAAERCRSKAAVGLREGGRIEYVEYLCAKLHVGLAYQLCVLNNGKVKVAIGRPARRVARCGSDGELWRRCKRGGVDEVSRRALISRKIWLTGEVWALEREAGEGVVICRLSDRDRH